MIRGQITFDGPVPPVPVLGEAHCQGGSGEPIRDESLLIDPTTHGVANVIVFLKGAPKSAASPGSVVNLDQHDCTYVPHVLAIQVGQTLHITSSDDTLHNVHLHCAVNPDTNLGYRGTGDAHDVPFNAPEPAFRINCDVHPWMSAWAAVFDHPYFAVTDAQGRFEIRNVPDGSYMLTTWHEKVPGSEKAVTIRGPAAVDGAFVMKAP